MKWHIWVINPDGPDGPLLLFHARCEDEKEVQALATEARHHSLKTRIWITPPNGQGYSWD